MKEIDAYCRYCSKLSKGKITAVTELESGNYLYIGECSLCLYEIRRIVPKVKSKAYPDSWYRQTPKGMQLTRTIQILYNTSMRTKIDTFIKVGKDPETGMWYWENRKGARSQAIFKNRKQAWAKGSQYIDLLKGKY